MAKADLTIQLKRKASQEAESRIKAAMLKQLAATAAAAAAGPEAASADRNHPADSAQWKCVGHNPDYPALAGQNMS